MGRMIILNLKLDTKNLGKRHPLLNVWLMEEGDHRQQLKETSDNCRTCESMHYSLFWDFTGFIVIDYFLFFLFYDLGDQRNWVLLYRYV